MFSLSAQLAKAKEPDMNFNKSSKAGKALIQAQSLKVEIAKMQTRLAVQTAILAAEAPNTGKHEVDGVGTFTVSENNSYDETLMREALTPGQVKRCSKAVLDKTVVKSLYNGVYLSAKKTVGLKVTVG